MAAFLFCLACAVAFCCVDLRGLQTGCRRKQRRMRSFQTHQGWGRWPRNGTLELTKCEVQGCKMCKFTYHSFESIRLFGFCQMKRGRVRFNFGFGEPASLDNNSTTQLFRARIKGQAANRGVHLSGGSLRLPEAVVTLEQSLLVGRLGRRCFVFGLHFCRTWRFLAGALVITCKVRNQTYR